MWEQLSLLGCKYSFHKKHALLIAIVDQVRKGSGCFSLIAVRTVGFTVRQYKITLQIFCVNTS